jgi:hypothetical protein
MVNKKYSSWKYNTGTIMSVSKIRHRCAQETSTKARRGKMVNIKDVLSQRGQPGNITDSFLCFDN